MPRISEFFGIIIYMYWFDIQKHKAPHIHARYAGKEAIFDLFGNCIEGELGKRGEKLIKDWCQERQKELKAAWKQAIEGKEIPWVPPLQ
ncbi:MAG: DUF4160 domain-containing protein [Deltaproteobacteria bacterium]